MKDIKIVMARVIYMQLHHQSNLKRAFLKKGLPVMQLTSTSQNLTSIEIDWWYIICAPKGKITPRYFLWCCLKLVSNSKVCVPAKVGDFLRSFSEYMVCFGRFDRSSGSEKLRLGDLDPTTRGHQYLSEQNFRETSSCPFFIFLIKCTHWVLKLCHTCYKLCVTCNKLPIEMVTTKYCKSCKCLPWSRFILRCQF